MWEFGAEGVGRRLQELETAVDEGKGVGERAHGHIEALPAVEICHSSDVDHRAGASRDCDIAEGIVVGRSWGCMAALLHCTWSRSEGSMGVDYDFGRASSCPYPTACLARPADDLCSSCRRGSGGSKRTSIRSAWVSRNLDGWTVQKL